MQQQPQRYLILSDFHLTGGLNPRTRVWSPTEDFFADEDFARFLAYYADDVGTTLIINGDMFDFLQVLEFPEKEDCIDGHRTIDGREVRVTEVRHRWRGTTFDYVIPCADIDTTYGLRCTAEGMRFLAGRVVEGHEKLFSGMVEFLRKGNRIEIIKGNHDVQLFWPEVQEEVLLRMEILARANAAGEDAAFVREQLRFLPWFYYVPGLLWVEHGNQYEYTTSFTNFLLPKLPFDYQGTSRHIELDLSSFLVRYLTNRGEPIDPLADNVRPLSRYWTTMWRNYPFQTITTFGIALTFVVKAFRKSMNYRMGHRHAKDMVRERNTEAMKNESKRFVSDADAPMLLGHLKAFDACKAEPTLSRGPFRFIWWLIRKPLYALLWLLPLYLCINAVDRWIILDDPKPGWLADALVDLARIATVALAAILLVLLRQWVRRFRRVLHKTIDENGPVESAGDGAAIDPPVFRDNAILDMRKMARYIAQTLGVRYVAFGHTHYADIHTLGDDRWYFNTGTWMPLIDDKEQIHRDMRQLTFLKIEHGIADLHCWYPPKNEPQKVVVFDLTEPGDDVENSIITTLVDRFRR